ncbi:hypothetical protein PISMIDRAFT_677368 [Pisolithus microcarpus 441]|uniref:Unplaced genomic scaffold scaffold_26, whole genome shotgun sequence n=1 Tax=Pisolithus microcarpus 441 TaxID=765257 RepID=A0A0C9ZGK4_9AGAM|nr:hypothetical protein PISMIDRAFT_677368 [Pisolithus microcarpus 441]
MCFESNQVDGTVGLGFVKDLLAKTVLSFRFFSYLSVFFPDTVMSSSGDAPTTSSLHLSFRY